MCWEEGRDLAPLPAACPRPWGLQGKLGFQLPPCVSSGDDSRDRSCPPSPAVCLSLSLFLLRGCWGALTKCPGRSGGPAWLLEMGVHTVLSANDCIGCWGLSLMKCLSDCSDRAGTEGSGGGSCSELAAGSQHSGTGACGCRCALLPDLLLSVSQKLPALGHIGRNIWPAASFFLPILPAKQPRQSQERPFCGVWP